MKIVYLGAGAAGRYCGACLHDNGLAALTKQGVDILLVPTYTPIRTDEENVSQARVFFGGINVYLQQNSSLFRHTPWFLDAMLDSPKLLAWLSKRAASMEVEKLGALTVSTLQGEHGRQRKEIAKLVHWLATEIKPDVVHLSNSMLVGAAREIRERLGVPIICSLAGEDIFLEQLGEPYYRQVRDLLVERCRDIDAFVSLNHYFADYMSDYLQVPRTKIEVIRHGLNLEGHGTRRTNSSPDEVVIGYFARVAIDKGLHVLAEAFTLLCADPTLPRLKLRVAGYMSGADKPYYDAIAKRLAQAGLSDRFEFLGELDRRQKIEFLQSMDLMSVPTVYHESKGISILEALANAVPVVLPAHGTFPELIADTGGGLLCEPENPQSLADAIKRLVLDPTLAADLGRSGQAAIRARYHAEGMAHETAALYRRFVNQPGVPQPALAKSAAPDGPSSVRLACPVVDQRHLGTVCWAGDLSAGPPHIHLRSTDGVIDMITVGMNYRVIPGKQQDFEDKFAAVLTALRGAPGHTNSSLYKDVSDDASYLIVSEWNDEQAFNEFIRSDAFRAVTNWGKEQILSDRPRHKVYKHS